MAGVTVLIPTFNHGPLVGCAIRSALAQTVTDLEVFVVGDGAPPETGELVGRLAAEDPRVRWFGNPKGPRNGELSRHAALQEASGEVVMYLSDDDLWFPRHVETVREALRDADLVAVAWVKLVTGAAPQVRITNWSRGKPVKRLLASVSATPLSTGAHTMSAYRALPHGWRTTPQGIATDMYMWQQFAAQPSSRLGASLVPTVLKIQSPESAGHPLEEALAWREDLLARLADPAHREVLLADVWRDTLRRLGTPRRAAAKPQKRRAKPRSAH